MTCPTSCLKCPRLVASRLNEVPGYGPQPADIMIVAMNPGMNEELPCNLRPLIGWSGEKLEVLTGHAGIDLAKCRLENIARCRPPRGPDGDLPPSKEEIENCAPFLRESIRLTRPTLVITLGELPMKWFLGPKVKFSTVRGKRHIVTVEGHTFDVVPMYHPAAAAGGRNPKLVGIMIEDWTRLGLKPPLRYETLGRYLEVSAGTLNTMLRAAWARGVRRFAFDFETDPTTHDWKGTFQARRGVPVGFSVACFFANRPASSVACSSVSWVSVN